MIEKMIKQEKQDGDVFNLYDAIAKATAEFPDLPRTKTVKFTTKNGHSKNFDYAPYHKVIQCIRPSLSKQGVSVMQAVHSEREGFMSMTLVVAGHGAMIASTIEFPHKKDIQEFGADVTYYKRYQVCSFFCLEGDPDADDFDLDKASEETPKAESKNKLENTVTKIETLSQRTVAKESPISEPEPEPKKPVTPQPISERLTYAMKQLRWKMEDFNKFCKQRPDKFPDFVHASNLSDAGKETLWNLLIEEAGVIPF
jgi:hypothetical protein